MLLLTTLFFGFGYGVAWQFEAVRRFYTGSSELLGPIEHLGHLFASDPKVLPFEMLRGLLWVGLALLVFRTTTGPAWVGGLLVSLLFSVFMNDVHLLPNP